MPRSAYKPRSVALRCRVTVISLGRQLPDASCSLPEADGGTSSPSLLLGLAPGGVCLAAAVTDSAGGPLTPPFHPRPWRGNILLCCTMPSRYRAWRLASTVLCGARTFLTSTHMARGATVQLAWAMFIVADGSATVNRQSRDMTFLGDPTCRFVTLAVTTLP